LHYRIERVVDGTGAGARAVAAATAGKKATAATATATVTRGPAVERSEGAEEDEIDLDTQLFGALHDVLRARGGGAARSRR
jgi:hypothetical protein